jgi:DNA helicase-2/ATP-dependent DNA helicase PcrA
VRAYADDDAEAAAVAQGCWEAFVEGVSWDQIAVLFRTNAQSARFEAACARRGVPCRLPGAGRFVERPVVRALLDELRTAERDVPARPFSDHLADLASAGDADEPDTGGAADAEVAPALAPGALAERRAYRAELGALGREYLQADGGPGSVTGFVAWLDLATSGERGPGGGVELLTFHRAKGLEWRVVFVTGLEHGLVPISWATAPEQLAEERRLLHVALGRAEDSLHLSWAELRAGPRRRRQARAPSPWLEHLELRAAAGAPVRVDRRAALAGVRAALAEASPPQPRSRRLPRAR